MIASIRQRHRIERRAVLLGASLCAAGLGARADAQGSDDRFVGTWGAAVDLGGQTVRLRLDIERTTDGLAAVLSPVDVVGPPAPSTQVSIDGDRLRADLPAIGGVLEVSLSDDGRLLGSLTQQTARAVAFVRDPDFAVLGAPPALTRESLAGLRAAAGSPALAALARRGADGPVGFVDGVRQVGEDAQATLQDTWHLGSITKSMTATLAAVLVEQGVLAWDATVGEVLADVAPEMRDDHRDATLLHLLSHRAGLQANIPTAAFMRYPREEQDARDSRRAYVAQALAQEPAGPKSDAFLYSNSGFVIAGAMMEARLAAPWEALAAERLFSPLGLASAGFGAPGTPGLLDQPVGHGAGLFSAIGLGGRRAPRPPGGDVADNPSVLGPAGRVHMSLPDLLIYLAAHRDGASLLSPASWERLHTPPFGGDYALGLSRRPDGALWHNGSNTFWYAEILIDRQRDVVAAAASNDGVLEKSRPAVAAALASAAQAAVA